MILFKHKIFHEIHINPMESWPTDKPIICNLSLSVCGLYYNLIVLWNIDIDFLKEHDGTSCHHYCLGNCTGLLLAVGSNLQSISDLPFFYSLLHIHHFCWMLVWEIFWLFPICHLISGHDYGLFLGCHSWNIVWNIDYQEID